jgi:Na+/melibiose symporter-like transporter
MRWTPRPRKPATKAALGLAAALGFGLLALAGFQAQADSQTPRALAGLTLAYAVLPVALKAVAIWLMWGFPITKAVHAENRARIEAG